MRTLKDILQRQKSFEIHKQSAASRPPATTRTLPVGNKLVVAHPACFQIGDLRRSLFVAVHGVVLYLSVISLRLVCVSMTRAALALLACSRSGARMASSRPSLNAFENA